MSRASGISNLDLATKQRIGELYQMGIPTLKIAKRLQLSIGTVRNYIHSPKGKYNRKKSIRIYHIISPMGKMHQVTNVFEFCLENNISSGNFYRLARGEVKTCKGWKFLKLEIVDSKDNDD